MLQNIRARLFFSSFTTNTADEPPRISIEISTSSPTLSKSGNPPFTITLKARVYGSRPVTIDTFQTVLFHRATSALDYQGLIFTDTTSGELAERRVIDVQYRVSDTLTARSDSVAEIPSQNDTAGPYIVQHTFPTPSPEQQQQASEPMFSSTDPEMRAIAKDLARTMSDQTVGLEVGSTYEIGLGDDMSQVSWWRPGSKADVFARGPVSRRAEGPNLKLGLVKTVTFMVVE